MYSSTLRHPTTSEASSLVFAQVTTIGRDTHSSSSSMVVSRSSSSSCSLLYRLADTALIVNFLSAAWKLVLNAGVQTHETVPLQDMICKLHTESRAFLNASHCMLTLESERQVWSRPSSEAFTVKGLVSPACGSR